MFSKNEEHSLLDGGFILLDEASWDTRESEPETDRSCCQGLFVHAQSCLTLRLRGLKPTRLLCPCDFPGKILWWVATSCSGDLPGLWMGPTPPASSGLYRLQFPLYMRKTLYFHSLWEEWKGHSVFLLPLLVECSFGY